MSPIVAKIVEKRGIAPEDLDFFFHPTIDRLAAPEELPGIVKAADVVLDSVVYRRKIVVFGDYDCDGVCATAILSRTLRTLGGNVSEFIPERRTEGYGMSDASVARMLKENPGVGLVVTVDNGINSIPQVEDIKRHWMSIVVTDHHLPGDQLPDANAIVDPKVSAPEGLQHLCGAGVAFLLANRIVNEAKRRGVYNGPNIGGPLLVMAGLATITDVMPLRGQNRVIVAEALKRFHSCAPTGLKELYARAARTASSVLTTRDFGFMIGPRINAAGRLASGMEALELLMTDDREITRELARIIDEYNVERKAVEQKMVDEAMEKVVWNDAEKTIPAPSQVIDLPNGHPGVAGVVAARVMEKLGYRVPVCVYAGGHGSARAPVGYNIRDALVACADLLDRFGGHAAAGGFGVKDGCMDEFRERLCLYCAEHFGVPDSSVSSQEPDVWVDAGDITLELADEFQLLEPYGEGNPEPVLGIRGVYFTDVKPMGTDGRHLALTLRDSGLRAVRWNAGDQAEDLRACGDKPCDVTFTLVISEYGERHVELRINSITYEQ